MGWARSLCQRLEVVDPGALGAQGPAVGGSG